MGLGVLINNGFRVNAASLLFFLNKKPSSTAKRVQEGFEGK